MKKAKNAELRELAQRNNVNLYEIAEMMGVADSTVYRWFRTEMSRELRDNVRSAIFNAGNVPPEDRV